MKRIKNKYPLFYQVENMNAKPEINFVEFNPVNLNGYTLIEGFPGLGLVGTISAKYIIERLDFEEAGHIKSDIFMPIIRVHNGLPVYPARFYINKKNKIAVLISEQIIPRIYTGAMAEAVVSWIKQKGISRLISLEGIKTHDQNGATKIYGIAANEKSKSSLEKHGLKIITDGITTGITSLILLELRRTNFDAISVLGNVKNIADYDASAEMIKKLNEILALNIDVKPLLKEAKETEKNLIKNLQKMKQTGKAVDKFEGRTPMYT
jgi:uncharacterized protein